MEEKDFNLEKEYYALFDVVNRFDERLITVKGWSVTLSLALLGTGFTSRHYGLFLVAAISGLGFWIIDALMKRHQMRYYPRMREIEYCRSEAGGNTGNEGTPKTPADKGTSTPQIDWGWVKAPEYFGGKQPSSPQWYKGRSPLSASWAFGHVALPHAVAVIAGIALLVLGRTGYLGDLGW